MTTATNDARHIREIIHELLMSELRPLLRQILDEHRSSSSTQDLNPGRLYSRKEAAAKIGVSVQTIAKLIEENALSCVRIRRRVLIPENELLRLLQQRGHSMGGRHA